ARVLAVGMLLNGLAGRGDIRRRTSLERLRVVDGVEQLLRLHRKGFAPRCGNLGHPWLRAVGNGHGRWLQCRYRQEPVCKGYRCDLVRRDDDALADLGETPQALRGACRQTDAAMRSGVARYYAQVHRDAGPGDALHVRHRRTAVDVRAVVAFAAD